METVIQRLERLYLTDNWSASDKEWLAEYLKGDMSELYFIALDGFSMDVLEQRITLTPDISSQILSNIHQGINPPKKVFPIRLFIKIAVAASIAGVFCAGYLFRKQMDNWLDPVKYEQTATLRGQLKLIQLPDGTSIWLNADSKIIYPDHFKGNTREVTLAGEAFFDVKHDSSRPFIIHSGKINTSVLGTSFNVKAYTDDKTIKVTVVTGKVGVVPVCVTTKHAAVLPVCVTTKHAAVLLTPNMEAVFNKSSKTLLSASGVDASSVTGWRQGNLQYHNTPLPEVLADVQRKYDVVIKADKNLLNCTLYADFNNLPLQKVLKIMGVLLNAHVVKDGKGYRLKGKGCN